MTAGNDSSNNDRRYVVTVSIPTCSIEEYAASNGVDYEVVKGWIRRGYIPSVKFGRHRLVNLALLTEQLKNQQHTADTHSNENITKRSNKK